MKDKKFYQEKLLQMQKEIEESREWLNRAGEEVLRRNDGNFQVSDEVLEQSRLLDEKLLEYENLQEIINKLEEQK
ncbi:MAG: Spo0E family sporulation regulatory protein-aspartic acid phosphatase [Christensenellaceae bacterium]|nr:Spo0E family sporulation regulatory protein-aspartic acid phosphatase [Christensenellaceae bacterium]